MRYILCILPRGKDIKTYFLLINFDNKYSNSDYQTNCYNSNTQHLPERNYSNSHQIELLFSFMPFKFNLRLAQNIKFKADNKKSNTDHQTNSYNANTQHPPERNNTNSHQIELPDFPNFANNNP